MNKNVFYVNRNLLSHIAHGYVGQLLWHFILFNYVYSTDSLNAYNYKNYFIASYSVNLVRCTNREVKKSAHLDLPIAQVNLDR